MEFTLNLGRAKSNKAMEAGIARHAALEEEVVYDLLMDLTYG